MSLRRWWSDRWPALAGLLVAFGVAACSETVGPEQYVPTVQFGSSGCPECEDTLSNDEWDDMTATLTMVEVQEEAPSICSSIYSQTLAQGKWEWGKAPSTVSWSGSHFPSAHGTSDPHFGIAEDYLAGTYGSGEIAQIMVHEQAHHMGWPANHSAWQGLDPGESSVEDNCFWW